MPIPGNEKVVSVAAGLGVHRRRDRLHGKVYAWGVNSVGQLGYAATPGAGSASPALITTLTGPAVSVAARTDFACAVMMDTTAECWGNNDMGQLGQRCAWAARSVPGPVVGLMGVSLTSPAPLAVGSSHACALLGSGNVACWGSSYMGQTFGTGVTGFYTSPLQVRGAVGHFPGAFLRGVRVLGR